MNLFDYLSTALGTIASQRGRSALTTLGVIIGVASVVLLISLAQGASRYVANSFAGLGTNLVQAIPGHRETSGLGGGVASTTNKLTLRDAEAVERRATAFLRVSGVIQGAATVKFEGRARDVMVFGIEDQYLAMREFQIDQGRDLTAEDVALHRRAAVIGRTLQKQLFGDENPLGQKLKIAGTEFRVVGMTKPRGTTFSIDLDDVAFIPVTSAMDLFELDGLLAIIGQTRNSAVVPLAKEQMRDTLMSVHDDQEDFTIFSPDDVLVIFGQISAAMTFLLAGIASISLVVGGIGIMNIMLVSVIERTREIGVRRALGATKTEILLQFLLESIAVSLLGGTIGLLLGGGVAFAVRLSVPELPVEISPTLVFVAVGFSVAVGVLSGVIPAIRAARLDPVEALRYE
jgi:putative ABC transport system permease protein